MILKSNSVYLRLFETDDYERTYKWHNDFEIQEHTCGTIRFVSKEIEKRWVESKAESNNKDIYLAICTLEGDEMIGYISINNIDYINRKCDFGGIVIGKENPTGFWAYIDSISLILSYAFDQLNMNRVCEACLVEHKTSVAQAEAFFFQREGIEKESVYKNGEYKDVIKFALLRSDYYKYIKEKLYLPNLIIKRLSAASKRNNNGQE